MNTKALDFTQEDIAFLLDQDSPSRGTPLSITATNGYIRNLDEGVKTQFANIKNRVLEPGFVLNAWCGDCVFNMVKEVLAAFSEYQAANAPETLPDGAGTAEKIAVTQEMLDRFPDVFADRQVGDEIDVTTLTGDEVAQLQAAGFEFPTPATDAGSTVNAPKTRGRAKKG